MKQDLNKIETIFKGIIEDVKEGNVLIEDASLELGTSRTVFTLSLINGERESGDYSQDVKTYFLRLQQVLERIRELKEKPHHDTFTKINLLSNDGQESLVPER